ncbi:SDR family oxidoreductase [Frankia sp. Cppng1_Ct_nod]|uniref:SDR family oxidoreductase n=1 Tax=Frankia sp. Cppng1_Ct_nod TaxID=2897162 RepID=UPI001A93FE68|nr:SDR family oxidoreductase [Frankia sp. Cppng1_Ct_nod]
MIGRSAQGIPQRSPDSHPAGLAEGALAGRRVLITGVSRPGGIGYAIAGECARAGAAVILTGLPGYDVEQGYPDAGPAVGPEALAARLREQGLPATALPPVDLADPHGPDRMLRAATAAAGPIDGLVVNHAYSVAAPLEKWTAEHIDRHLTVNVRGSMLLLKGFVDQLPHTRAGSVVLLTSGQYLGPMTEEIAYAVSKDAVRGLCAQAAAALADRLVRVNCVNPGPTDTGYLTGDEWDGVRRMFPAGRWGTPSDAARLVCFLLGKDAEWITGQTIASEGGFRR